MKFRPICDTLQIIADELDDEDPVNRPIRVTSWIQDGAPPLLQLSSFLQLVDELADFALSRLRFFDVL